MKNTKKILSLIFCLLLMMSLSLTAFCTGSDNLVVDDADLLTVEEEPELETLLVQYSEENQASIAVLTTNDFEGKDVVTFSDDYYDYNGYGYGDTADGLLLVVNLETRDWYITTAGRIIDEIPSYVIDSIGESFVPYLSSGDYLDAFMTYAERVNMYLGFVGEYSGDDFVIVGDEYDDYYYNDHDFDYVLDENGNIINLNKGESFIKNLGIAIVIGVILSFITVSIMKGKLKSVRVSTEAREYMKADTLSVTKTSDRFLYRNVTRTAKPKNNSSSRGGGGGVHMGSSGRSHGGGGGKF